MQITKTKLKAAGYAVKNRLLGYHLLKNSKEASPETVNMIKYSHNTNDYNDYVTSYVRIHKNFAQTASTETRENLKSTRYSLDGKTLTNKKSITYIPNNKENSKMAQKTDGHSLDERIMPTHNLEFMDNAIDILLEKDSQKFYASALENVSMRSNIEGTGKRTRPNFFKVLWDNLSK